MPFAVTDESEDRLFAALLREAKAAIWHADAWMFRKQLTHRNLQLATGGVEFLHQCGHVNDRQARHIRC